MILINLLPPELRRARGTGFNPVLLAAAAGLVLVLFTALLWAWVEFGRIGAATKKLAQLDEDLKAATAKAEAVKAIDKEIIAAEKLHGVITKLITRKVFWSRTLDDFANLLAQANNNRWTMDGYEVRCTTLAIQPVGGPASARGKAKGPETVTYSFRASFRIVGELRDKVGDYERDFFRSVDRSEFWRNHGFVGRAEDPYKGDSPKMNVDIQRVVVDMPLEWRRAKVIASPTAAAEVATAPKGGK